MAFGRDIVIHLADASIAEDDVRQALENFVTVLSVCAAPHDAATLHARLLSPTHVDHLLNVLSGRLRVGRFLCAFARPSDTDSDEEDEDETLVEDLHGSFHDAFLTPTKFKSGLASSSPIAIPMLDKSSVFLTPPASLSSASSLSCDYSSSASAGSPTPAEAAAAASAAAAPAADSIPIGLHPEIAVLDPSPERPENRAPRRRVAELAEIYDNGCLQQQEQGEPVKLVPNYESDAFLPLAPPYHLLPNTPYFRNAPIAPPPLKPAVPPPPPQRIINRYLNSMKAADNLDEMEIQSLMCFNFNRTIGACPYTLPEKAPLALGPLADDDDAVIDEDWSIWSGGEQKPTQQRTRLITH